MKKISFVGDSIVREGNFGLCAACAARVLKPAAGDLQITLPLAGNLQIPVVAHYSLKERHPVGLKSEDLAQLWFRSALDIAQV